MTAPTPTPEHDVGVALLREVADVLSDVRHHAHVRNCPSCPLVVGDLLSRIMAHLNTKARADA